MLCFICKERLIDMKNEGYIIISFTLVLQQISILRGSNILSVLVPPVPLVNVNKNIFQYLHHNLQ